MLKISQRSEKKHVISFCEKILHTTNAVEKKAKTIKSWWPLAENRTLCNQQRPKFILKQSLGLQINDALVL